MIKTVPVSVLWVALALGSVGCSLLFVQPLAPNYQSGDPVTCTSNVAAPVIDTIFTALDTVELVAVAGNSNPQNRTVLMGATLGIIIWGASAIYGYQHTSECSEAQNDSQGSYRTSRRRAPAPGWAPPAPRQRLSPPPPAAPPGPVPEEAAPPPAPSVTVPSAPAAP